MLLSLLTGILIGIWIFVQKKKNTVPVTAVAVRIGLSAGRTPPTAGRVSPLLSVLLKKRAGGSGEAPKNNKEGIK